jgi:hypothetical protein
VTECPEAGVRKTTREETATGCRPITRYFVGPEENEEFRRFRESRRSFATAELPKEKAEAMRGSRMDPRHPHLDEPLDPK